MKKIPYERKEFMLRLPMDLYEQLVESSEKNRRTVTNELIVILEGFLNENPQKKISTSTEKAPSTTSISK